MIALCFIAAPHDARAQANIPPPPAILGSADAKAMDGALQTHLAYVITGNADVDRMSQLGLLGLTPRHGRAHGVEAADPVGIDPERDDLTFFPLLYWPMTAEQKVMSDPALGKLDAYMKNGGTILFDTRDGDAIGNSIGMGTQTLQKLLGRLDIPPLVPIPEDHVLTQSFYLLQDFPAAGPAPPCGSCSTPAE